MAENRLDALLVPFPRAVRMLGLPLRSAERMLKRGDPQLPPVLRAGRWRYIAREEIEKRARALPQRDDRSLLTILDHVHAQP